jgi:hypothetical protein
LVFSTKSTNEFSQIFRVRYYANTPDRAMPCRANQLSKLWRPVIALVIKEWPWNIADNIAAGRRPAATVCEGCGDKALPGGATVLLRRAVCVRALCTLPGVAGHPSTAWLARRHLVFELPPDPIMQTTKGSLVECAYSLKGACAGQWLRPYNDGFHWLLSMMCGCAYALWLS